MAIVKYEAFKSRNDVQATDKSSTETVIWFVRGTSDEDTASAQVVNDFPDFIGDLKRKTLRRDKIAPDAFQFTGLYVHPDKAKEDVPENEFRWTFDTTGGQAHITQSKSTVSSTAIAGENAPDFKQAIGVDGDSVKGADVTIPAMRLTLTAKMRDADLTLDYARTCKDLTGKTNDAAFLGFPAGELLFLGAVGSEVSEGTADVTWSFLASENLTSIDIGGVITVPAKKGHELLWVFYEEDEDGTANKLVQTPFAAYVEKVANDGDFSDLEIPGA